MTEESPARLHQVVGVLIASAAIVAVLVAIFAGKSASQLQPGKPVPGEGESNALFAGIEEQGLSLGSPRAPVTLVEFGDLQCPSCAGFAEKSLPTLVSDYVRPGKLRIVFRPLDIIGSESLRAARMAVALGQQGRLWPFVDLMYRNQGAENSGYVTSTYLRALGDAVQGASVNEAFAAMGSGTVNAAIARSVAEAKRLGVTATPSFLLSRTGEKGRRFQPTSTLEAAAFTTPIDRLLHRRG